MSTFSTAHRLKNDHQQLRTILSVVLYRELLFRKRQGRYRLARVAMPTSQGYDITSDDDDVIVLSNMVWIIARQHVCQTSEYKRTCLFHGQYRKHSWQAVNNNILHDVLLRTDDQTTIHTLNVTTRRIANVTTERYLRLASRSCGNPVSTT